MPGGRACLAGSFPVGTPLGQPRAARTSVWSSMLRQQNLLFPGARGRPAKSPGLGFVPLTLKG